MKDLIAALQIFSKYGDPHYPTWCEHDALRVCVDPADVSDEDKAALEKLSFYTTKEGDFVSFRFGHC